MIRLLIFFLTCSCFADSTSSELTLAQQDKLIESQDHLSGDVQEMIELQTQEGVIKKLEEMEASMIEATLRLLDHETGSETISIQTEIIEKAYETAKEKQKSQNSQSETDQALMDMLEKMLGKKEEKMGEGEQRKGKKERPKAGNGGTGGSGDDLAPSTSASDYITPVGERRSVPSTSPTAGQLLPIEFQEWIEDYNRR